MVLQSACVRAPTAERASQPLLDMREIKPPMLRSQLTSKAVHMGVIRRPARPAEVQLHLVVIRPLIQCSRGELGPLIHRDDRRQPAPTLQLAQHPPDVLTSEALLRVERHALTELPEADVSLGDRTRRSTEHTALQK
jgi:hypothetical protein